MSLVESTRALDTDADLGFLKRTTPPMLSGFKDADISVIDLFSGCGGLTVGAIEAATRLATTFDLALDRGRLSATSSCGSRGGLRLLTGTEFIQLFRFRRWLVEFTIGQRCAPSLNRFLRALARWWNLPLAPAVFRSRFDRTGPALGIDGGRLRPVPPGPASGAGRDLRSRL